MSRIIPPLHVLEKRLFPTNLESSIEIDPGIIEIRLITGKRSATPCRSRDIAWQTTQEYEGELGTDVAVQLITNENLFRLSEISSFVPIHPIRLINHPSPSLNMFRVALQPQRFPPTRNPRTPCTASASCTRNTVFGTGIKISIVDSGFSYRQLSLGGWFGCSCKFGSGYDFVGGDYSRIKTRPPDNDGPWQSCNLYNIGGVAYKASLAGCRIFGCEGSVSDDAVIAAIIRVYHKDAAVSSHAGKNRQTVTIGGGSEESASMWYASGPTSGMDLIVVTSVDDTVIPVQYAKVSGHEDIVHYSLAPLKSIEFLLIYAISKMMFTKLEIVVANGGHVALIYNNESPNSFTPEYTLGATGSLNRTGDIVSILSTYGPTIPKVFSRSSWWQYGLDLPTTPGLVGHRIWHVHDYSPWVNVTALLLEAKGNTTAKMIPRTATAPRYPAAAQGGGLINAHNSVHYRTVVFPGQLSLNDTVNFKGKHTIKITHGSKKTQTYRLNHKLTGTAQSLQPGLMQMNLHPSITVGFTASNVDASMISVYTKYIELLLNSMEYLSGEKIPATLNAEGNMTTGEQTYTFTGNNIVLVILFRLMILLGYMWEWIKVWLNGSGNENSSIYPQIPIVATCDCNPHPSDPSSPDVGHSTFVIGNNTFANNPMIPNGRYTILLGELKIMGNLTNATDYKAWVSPPMV
ncbi:hypothetical protein CPB86DRAFT_777104 [Serendipita vermifera]|nr:hypothetical protein CPB86DRAFT_777104 [Serendipita vermifera]